MSRLLTFSLALLAVARFSNAYFLMGAKNYLATERLDAIVSPGRFSAHVHSFVGGSGMRDITNTSSLQKSLCTSVPIVQDKSAYWHPLLYFQWKNGSFTSVTGGVVINTPGTTTPFPTDFRMISGDPSLRSYNASSFAQQAITFLCLDFNGVSTRFNSLPAQTCPSGIRSQINFPSCWNGKDVDSADHKSHVAFLSTGPDSGSCTDPNFPVTLPRVFMEVYWATNAFDAFRSQAMNTSQPFVFSNGDPWGWSNHADFMNGWEPGVLQGVVDKCNCNEYGDPTCCAEAGLFTLDSSSECHITKEVDEVVLGTLPKLPGNNPVRPGPAAATNLPDNSVPGFISPVCEYTGTVPPATCATATATPSTPSSSGSQAPTASLSTSIPSSSGSQASTASPSTSIPSSSGSQAPTASPSANVLPIDPATSTTSSFPSQTPTTPANNDPGTGSGNSSSSPPMPSPTPVLPPSGSGNSSSTTNSASSSIPSKNPTSDDGHDHKDSCRKKHSRRFKRSSHSRQISRRLDNVF